LFVVTGLVVVPDIPSQHRFAMEDFRQAFDMGLLAQEALSIPPKANLAKVMVATQKCTDDKEAKRTTCHVSISIQMGAHLPAWCPPTNVTALVGGLCGSFVVEDTRWFLNKRDASRHTLLCAALVGNKGFTSNVLVPRHFASAGLEDKVVLQVMSTKKGTWQL
jgi:hypothetical protein